jgi:predicted nucleotidyltransferase
VVSNAIDKELERLREKVAPILRRLGVRRASVFGSLARGEGDEESDVDCSWSSSPVGACWTWPS